MSKKYEISTIADVLALEQDQIERFCEDLPHILAYIKSMQAAVGLVSKNVDVDQFAQAVTPLTWFDDDK